MNYSNFRAFSRYFFVSLVLIVPMNLYAIGLEEYKYLRSVSEHFKTLCPPKDCVVVGLGGSPVLFEAYLENQADDYVWKVPLSDFRYGTRGRPLTADQEARLHRHFSSFLPTQEELKGRSILVIDYAQSGDSLVASRNKIRDFYSDDHWSPRVRLAAMASEKDYQHWKIHPEIQDLILLPNDDSFMMKIENQAYKEFSPFGKFHIEDEKANVTSNPKYEALRKEIREFQDVIPSSEYEAKRPGSKPKLIHDDGKHRLVPFDRCGITETKVRLVSQIRYLPPTEHEKLFIAALKNPDEAIRETAMKQLAHYQGVNPKKVFELALKTSEGGIRQQFTYHVLAYPGSERDQYEIFSKLFNDQDASVRESNLVSCGSELQSYGSGTFVNCLKAGLESTFPETRLKAVEVFGRFREAMPKKIPNAFDFYKAVYDLGDSTVVDAVELFLKGKEKDEAVFTQISTYLSQRFSRRIER